MVYYNEFDQPTSIDNPVIWMAEYGVYASNGGEPVCISKRINSELLTRNLNGATIGHDASNNRLHISIAEG